MARRVGDPATLALSSRTPTWRPGIPTRPRARSPGRRALCAGGAAGERGAGDGRPLRGGSRSCSSWASWRTWTARSRRSEPRPPTCTSTAPRPRRCCSAVRATCSMGRFDDAERQLVEASEYAAPAPAGRHPRDEHRRRGLRHAPGPGPPGRVRRGRPAVRRRPARDAGLALRAPVRASPDRPRDGAQARVRAPRRGRLCACCRATTSGCPARVPGRGLRPSARRARRARCSALLEPFAGRNVVTPAMAYVGPVDRYLGLLAATAGDHEQAAALFASARSWPPPWAPGRCAAQLALDEAEALRELDPARSAALAAERRCRGRGTGPRAAGRGGTRACRLRARADAPASDIDGVD